jgi:hypothetical protein
LFFFFHPGERGRHPPARQGKHPSGTVKFYSAGRTESGANRGASPRGTSIFARARLDTHEQKCSCHGKKLFPGRSIVEPAACALAPVVDIVAAEIAEAEANPDTTGAETAADTASAEADAAADRDASQAATAAATTAAAVHREEGAIV